MKAIFKYNVDMIIGNMYSAGERCDNNPSYSVNGKKSEMGLMTIDEFTVMDGDKCVILLRGVRPFIWDKYDVSWHSFYKGTGEYNDGNKLDIQRFVCQALKVRFGEGFGAI